MATENQIRMFFAKRLDFLLPEQTDITHGNHYGQIQHGPDTIVLSWEPLSSGVRKIYSISITKLITLLDLTNLSTLTVQGVKDHIDGLSNLTADQKTWWKDMVDQLNVDGVFD